MNALILKLKSELSEKLPGIEAQNKMSPVIRGKMIFNLPERKAGVLILLFPQKSKIYTIFIKRTEYDGAHSGQISFPGGMYEPEDSTLENTALREAEEETGISRNYVKIIGQLTSLHIPISNTEVFPFVGYTEIKPVFFTDPVEVEYLIEAELNYLTDPLRVCNKKMKIHDIEIDVPYFDIEGHHIWGATAMMLNEFIEVTKKVLQKS